MLSFKKSVIVEQFQGNYLKFSSLKETRKLIKVLICFDK